LSGEENQFPSVIRGYDKEAVNEAIQELNRDLMKLSIQNTQLVEELRQARLALLEAQNALQEVAAPSYGGLGAQAAIMLSSAEDQATRLVHRAEEEKTRILGSIDEEVLEKRTQAQDYYDSLIAEADRRVERTLSSTRQEANEIIVKARNEAERLVEEAVRDAASQRGAIATEVARLRSDTKRQTENLKAQVERDLAEKKMISQLEKSAELDTERATQLLTEQARIDLELELTARRAEAEEEYLRKHQEAVMQTQQYLDDANAQLALAVTRASAAALEAETLEAAARSINKKTTDKAKATAETVIATAEAQARDIISEARRTAAKQLEESSEKLYALQVERRVVGSYLEQLEKVVEQSRKSIE
jgi:cell division septum initiation protein DivIVA